MDVKWFHTVVLICISRMASETDDIFMCLLATCVLYLFWINVQIFGPFLNWAISVKTLFSCKSSLCSLDSRILIKY